PSPLPLAPFHAALPIYHLLRVEKLPAALGIAQVLLADRLATHARGLVAALIHHHHVADMQRHVDGDDPAGDAPAAGARRVSRLRSEEHTSELQSRVDLV